MAHPFSSDETAQSRRALLSSLEASLRGSQLALLSGDFARLEQCTREQIAWQRSLEAVGWQGICDSESGAALRAAQLQVRHAGRVQAALLDRAQRWLRTLSNLVAGPESNYLPPSGRFEPYQASLGGSMAPHALRLTGSLADRPTLSSTVHPRVAERN